MMRRAPWLLVVAVSLVAAMGCAGDLARMVTSNAETRDKVMSAISGSGALAGQMVDRLLAADSTRDVVVERVLNDGGAAQAVLVRIARDPSKMDGVLALAVQDSAMRDHVMTLFKGMQIGAATGR